jgi:hypothetical protein
MEHQFLKLWKMKKWNKANIMTKRLLFGTLMSPTSVATIHQLLLSQFNWLQWERVEQNASIDAVIFDEIHSYEFSLPKLFDETCHQMANLMQDILLAVHTYERRPCN